MQLFSDAVRWGALALILPALGGCSEYLARRDGISIYGGDAVAGNRVVQMVDPWPRVAADRTIAYDGAVIDRAVQRYHQGRVIVPHIGGTSSAYQDAGSAAQASEVSAPAGATQSAAATK